MRSQPIRAQVEGPPWSRALMVHPSPRREGCRAWDMGRHGDGSLWKFFSYCFHFLNEIGSKVISGGGRRKMLEA